MARDWYIRISNVENDPISSDTLRKLVVEGRVTRETFIKKGVSGTWSRAGNVAGLFPLAPSQPTPQPAASTHLHDLGIPTERARAETLRRTSRAVNRLSLKMAGGPDNMILFRFLQVVTVMVAVGTASLGLIMAGRGIVGLVKPTNGEAAKSTDDSGGPHVVAPQRINQTTVIEQTGQHGTSRVVDYSKAAFDPSLDQLPAGFVGHDTNRLLEAVEGKLYHRPKDEFETTQQYENRLQIEEKKPLFAEDLTLSLDSVFASAVVRDAEHLRTSYNADLRRLHAELRIFHDKLREPYQEVSMQADNRYVPPRFFFRNLADYRPTTQGNPYVNSEYYVLDFELPMDIDTARAAKSNLRVLFIYCLVSPFIKERGGKHITANVEQIWLYNFDTGEIYSKVRPAGNEEQAK